MQYYVLITWDDVEPDLMGPFRTKHLQTTFAQTFRKDKGKRHGLFKLDIMDAQEGQIAVDSFAAHELDFGDDD